MNHPMNMQNGYMGQNQYFPQGGFATLDPNCCSGQVTMDAGQPYQSCYGQESMHGMHHNPHHCCVPPCPPPCPPPAPEPVTYVVRKGDSVYKIAQQFGTTMQAIILANNLTNPDLIFPGQVFIIPNA
ncbi:LysM peptidoglycan-binding domain-containing protein [Desulfitobacterium chlororespirans]|uniref:LysM domain-containing protein n=1 Tax=Desulfitobacterium chlororespirans DSM 11544 TaxID=1121395 RepID=A0A1M7SB80_9FIRM|nr:LysM domain-containing protein [Desulfitobacterium chlororespirans]SHN55770.1 LysM domain-containing protein [Desulfitobacterium chlororespirans DSM 11544]